ncbi:hypothetical protein [Desulfosporosinus sp. Sb-LF]|uniref:hypothetical protein n=1 Tax=Desulfosporosinus sp. Sb-LF TaxID=2560027 RepID=UPI00107FA06D|nr:hypothetical protein [Desulfosporosinus sp. Sb-LF]TGE32854.1 hypothetical protein E4K68_08370 [Desulfosporosinus sp. Sb-LF]
MAKIKDRNTLAIVSGMIGLAGLMLVDIPSHMAGISKRSYREAAAGMFVSKSEAKTLRGHILGFIMNSAVSILGAKYIINDMSKNGRDKILAKGVLAGIGIGAIATAIPNVVPQNSVKPKDAASNLSYVFSNMVYGLLTTFSASKLGHDSLFDTPPQNDYLKPTEQTSEQIKLAPVSRNTVQPIYSDVNSNAGNTVPMNPS